MASTNKTPNLGLSQFQPLDKPAWLGDYNQDMSKIDTAVHNNQTKVDSMETNVNVAISSADAATKAAQAATEAAAEATSVAQNAQTTANNVSGTATQALSIAQQAQETAETAQTTANNALPKSGGTMTGPLILSGAPTQDNQAATKAYVDSSGGSSQLVVNWLTYTQTSQSPILILRAHAIISGKIILLFFDISVSITTAIESEVTYTTTIPAAILNDIHLNAVALDTNKPKTPSGVRIALDSSGNNLTIKIGAPTGEYPLGGGTTNYVTTAIFSGSLDN